jgi:hypothetical protein
MPGAMSANLEKALTEEGDHPWAFDKRLSQMRGIVPNGTYVAFVRLTLPSGADLGRQGPVEMNTRVHRIVLGRITRGIRQVAAPFFEGFPYEFWYELIADLGLEATTELAERGTPTEPGQQRALGQGRVVLRRSATPCPLLQAIRGDSVTDRN